MFISACPMSTVVITIVGRAYTYSKPLLGQVVDSYTYHGYVIESTAYSDLVNLNSLEIK